MAFGRSRPPGHCQPALHIRHAAADNTVSSAEAASKAQTCCSVAASATVDAAAAAASVKSTSAADLILNHRSSRACAGVPERRFSFQVLTNVLPAQAACSY